MMDRNDAYLEEVEQRQLSLAVPMSQRQQRCTTVDQSGVGPAV